MVETGHMRTPNTCPRSQDCEKLGGGLHGNKATHPLDSCTATQVSETGCQITRTLLCRLDEVSQLLNEVGHLLCEASQLLYEVGHQIVVGQPSWGVAG